MIACSVMHTPADARSSLPESEGWRGVDATCPRPQPPSADAPLSLRLVGRAGLIAGAWVGSRLLVAIAALAVGSLVPRNPALTAGSPGGLLGALTSWDGWWYLGIARNGYHAAALAPGYHDYAFFPLYPLLVRILSFPIPRLDGLVAVLISNALFLVALALLYRLTCEVLDERRATLTCVYLCLFPFAWVFSMAYGEGLFLVLTLWALLEAEHGHAGRAAVLASLAGATRLPGILLMVPIALILWRRVSDRRALAWLAFIPVFAAAFLAYTAWLSGSLGSFAAEKTGWGSSGIGTAGAGTSLGAGLDPLQASLLVTFLAYVFLLVYLRPDRVPLAYATIPVLTLAAVFARGELESVGRYGMVAFPFVWALAGRGSRWFRLAWPIASSVLFVVTAVVAFSGHAAP